jgi:hypothetical protein
MITAEEVKELNAKATKHQGHSWVHSFFRKGKQYGESTCFGVGGEKIFTIAEKTNPNAENDYQFYANAPAMAELIVSQAAELKRLKQALCELDTGGTDYFQVRKRLAKLSGVLPMAISVDEHFAKIEQALNNKTTGDL